MQARKWKAFVRLNGETMVNTDRDIVNDFAEFAKQLEHIGVEYSIVVSVDKGPIRQYSAKTGRFQSLVSSAGRPRTYARPEGD